MRKIILLLLLPVLTWAQTVTISARNWGPDSAAADAAIADKFAAFLLQTEGAASAEWLAYYEYDQITDSTVWVEDWGQPDPSPIHRAFNPSEPAKECPVSPIWCVVRKAPDTLEVIVGEAPSVRYLHAAPPEEKVKTKKGKVTTVYMTFSTWDGGPVPTGVKPLNKGQLVSAMAHAAKLRLAVDKDMADGLTWKKNGKPLDKAAKRKAAWRVETGKDKASDYSKTK